MSSSLKINDFISNKRSKFVESVCYNTSRYCEMFIGVIWKDILSNNNLNEMKIIIYQIVNLFMSHKSSPYLIRVISSEPNFFIYNTAGWLHIRRVLFFFASKLCITFYFLSNDAFQSNDVWKQKIRLHNILSNIHKLL